MSDNHTKRLEVAFNTAKECYDVLKEQFFKVKGRLTLANEKLDKEYDNWKKSRHDNNNNMATTTTTTKFGAAAIAQARFDRAQDEYNVINEEFIRLEKDFKKKDIEMDEAYEKWKSSRKGRIRDSAPACWNRQRKACGGIVDLCSSDDEEEEEADKEVEAEAEKEVEAEAEKEEEEEEEKEAEKKEDKKLPPAAPSSATNGAAPCQFARTDRAARRLARKTPASAGPPLPFAKRPYLERAVIASAAAAIHESHSLYKVRAKLAASENECVLKRNAPALQSQHQKRRHVSSPELELSPREWAVVASAAAAVTPTTRDGDDDDDENDDDDVDDEAETKSSCKNPPRAPPLPLQQSAGRSRKWLNDNMSRLEAHGIFAKFGQSSFNTSDNNISQLVFNNEWNQIPARSNETWTIYVGVGTRRVQCAEKLANMRVSVPVFFDRKEQGLPIYYVGHWKPIPGSLVKPPQDKERCMKLDLVLERFDEDLSAVMDN